MASVIANQGDTVDAICWRYYGRTAGVTETVLDANPGLADLGPVIPHGTAVTLPDAAPQAEQRQVVNLWD
ncbi:phage tail protein [Pseudomonas fluvialis]|uniref:Phage tail protein n=1 Tax=Pseudomonas fluvialis TaxID=1793966 RepID=A0A2I0CNZ0_9PSED|nr:tail protein X [Pseudomonas pharmacofabricae]PKF70868.1 phage tail protein [Pseudomonas pharmacofabricae]